MKAAEDALPASKFIRIHKSHIVSISSITAVRKSTMFIDDVELPVGEQYRNAVQSLIDG
jgi:two-component system LytT family response regulator